MGSRRFYLSGRGEKCDGANDCDWLNRLRLRASEKTAAAYGWQLRRLVKEFPSFAASDSRRSI